MDWTIVAQWSHVDAVNYAANMRIRCRTHLKVTESDSLFGPHGLKIGMKISKVDKMIMHEPQ